MVGGEVGSEDEEGTVDGDGEADGGEAGWAEEDLRVISGTCASTCAR